MPKIEMGKKYRYRNGKPARILCTDKPRGSFSVISMADDGTILTHRACGKVTLNDELDAQDDLIEFVEPVTVPLEAMDILPSYRFTHKNGAMNFWESATAAGKTTVILSGTIRSYGTLQNLFYMDRLDGKGWVACEKELHQEA